jgi:hypothetical protein
MRGVDAGQGNVGSMVPGLIVAMLLLFASMAPPAANAVTADADFAARCNAALATGGRCFAFDTAADIPTANGQDCWGCNFGAFAPGQHLPEIDTTVKASGGGSLKFTTPPLSGSSGGGSWFTNFSNPATAWQVGPGDDVWVQFRYRPSPATLSLSNSNVPIASSPGFKLSHVGDGDTAACNTGTGKNTANCPGSCSDMEVVVQPNWDSTGGNHLGAYTTCNNGTVGQPIMTVTRDGGQTYDRHPNWTGSPARSCNYPGPYNEPKCFVFRPNEWHTIKYHIHVNAWNTWTNTIQIWAAHEGEPLQLLINCAPGLNCSDNNNATVQGFFLYNSDTGLYKLGKVWLDPYVTRQGVDAPGPLAETTVWYDELIISKQDIADPGATTPGLAPTAPCCLRLTELSPVPLVALGLILVGRRWRRRATRRPDDLAFSPDEGGPAPEDGEHRPRSHGIRG